MLNTDYFAFYFRNNVTKHLLMINSILKKSVGKEDACIN